MNKKKSEMKYNLYLYRGLMSCVLLFCISISSFAQDDKISISFKDELLTDVLKKLEKEVRYSFAYQSDIIPRNYRITKLFTNQSLEYILSDILKGTGIVFHILDEQIIIKKQAKRKKYTLSGYLTDPETGQPIVNANVYEKDSYVGVVSNEYGYYSLSLPEGVYDIVVSFIGVNPVEQQFVFDKDIKLNLNLSQNINIEEVVVNGAKVKELISSESSLGKINIDPKQFSSMPTIMAEPDIIKSIQLLPGMQSGSEGNGAVYVRGGNPIQNLFLLDNVPIYNCYHLLGLFSVFNADIIGETNVYKGGFPAKHGGRLSSVLDMKTKDGNFKEYQGKVSLGLISSRFAFEGPLFNENTSFAVTGRLGYYYLYGKLIPEIANGGNVSSIDDYNFYDVNLKLTHKFSNKSKIYLSLYSGKDVGENISGFKSEYPEAGYIYFTESIQGQNWQNLIGTLGWAGQISSKLFANIQIATSNYSYDGYLKDSVFSTSSTDTSSYSFKTNLDNLVTNNFISSDFQYVVNPKMAFNFGYKFTILQLKSDNLTKENITESNSYLAENNTDTITSNFAYNTNEHSVYLEIELQMHKRFNITTGVHSSVFNSGNYSNISFQPRVIANWEFFHNFMLKGAYSQMVQHLHHLGVSNEKRASDLLVSPVENAPSEMANQYSLGISILKFNNLKFHVDAYYKEMDNLVNFKEGTSYFTESANWSDKVVGGTGIAKGIEFLVEKPLGKLSGWVGYSLSNSNRTFEGINKGNSFPYRYEHRHHLSIVAKYKFSEKWILSANWLYHTGNRESIPDVLYWDPGNVYNQRYGMQHGSTKFTFNQKNAYVNPDYHRLDLSLNYKRTNKLGEANWVFSIYNVYNRANVYSSNYGETHVPIIGNVDYMLRNIDRQKLFGIIPSISYSLTF